MKKMRWLHLCSAARRARPLPFALAGVATALAVAGCGSARTGDPAGVEPVAASRSPLSVGGDLSNIGAGSFSISFQIATSQSTGVVGVLGQRSICTFGQFWDVRLNNGQVVVETDDGTSTNYRQTVSSGTVANGALHSVLITRSGGTVSISIDGVASGSGASPAPLGPLSAVSTGNYGCVDGVNTKALSGTLSNIVVDGAPVFTNDLSNIGTGNFAVSFQLTTNQSTGVVGVLGQRSVCSLGEFWDVRLNGGHVLVETDDGTPANYAALTSSASVADGATHTVVVQRGGGNLAITVDGVASGRNASPASLGPLSAVSTGVYGCVGHDATVQLSGTLSNVSYTPGWVGWIGPVGNHAQSIAVGANNVPWIVGTESPGAGNLYYGFPQPCPAGTLCESTAFNWTQVAGITGAQISANVEGGAFAVNSAGQQFALAGSCSAGKGLPTDWVQTGQGVITSLAAESFEIVGNGPVGIPFFTSCAGNTATIPHLWGIGSHSPQNQGSVFVMSNFDASAIPRPNVETWQQVDPADGPSGLTVALFTNDGPPLTQTPWVTTQGGGLYSFNGNKFVQMPGLGTALTDHFVVGMDGNVYQWNDATATWIGPVLPPTPGGAIGGIAYSSPATNTISGTVGPSWLWAFDKVTGDIYYAQFFVPLPPPP